MSNVSVAVGNARLTKLALFLMTLPEERFDFGVVCEATGVTLAKVKEDPYNPACGTTACAMGWAPSIPSFRRAGMSLRWKRLNESWHAASICFGGRKDFGAAQRFFGLTPNESYYLFNPGNSRPDGAKYKSLEGSAPDLGATSAQVAEHILKFVASRTKF